MMHDLDLSDAPDRTTSGKKSQLTQFMRFCEARLERKFDTYWEFDRFSVKEFRTFWSSFVEWSVIPLGGSLEPVCQGDKCETAQFFPGATLNYAESLLTAQDGRLPAVSASRANGPDERIDRAELRRRVLVLAVAFRRLGIGPGDRVAAIVRNRPEAVVAMLATTAIGAVFSSCAPETGANSILERFKPITPKLLLAHIEAAPWDRGEPVHARVMNVAAGLDSLEHVMVLDGDPSTLSVGPPLLRYEEILGGAEPEGFRWTRFPFNHPLCILFSSGTTGPPKCIVHGAGGTLLEHLKEHRLHCDLTHTDRLYFHTSCAWMMWNWQLSALASGAEIVLYDGPVWEPDVLWKLVARWNVTVFGTSPAYLQLSESAAISPRSEFDLASLRAVISTGSILYERQFDWVHEHVKDVPVQSISGGTDIIGCFVLGNPLLPVHRGEAQCRSLGLDVRSLSTSEDGSAVGELVCANPFPSRPLGFLGDDLGTTFHHAYFSQHPTLWTHGDLIEFSSHGGVRLHGRSDGILNIRGVRIGPAEIYRILRSVDEVVDAIAVEQTDPARPGGGRLILLVTLRSGLTLTPELVQTIRSRLASDGSVEHVPAKCVAVPELPTTFSGKRSEAAARDVVNGREVRNRAALSNPASLDAIRAALDADALDRPAPDDLAASQDEIGLRDALCQIISRRIGVVVGPQDNILGFGADSLTLVLLATEISELVGSDLAGDAFFSAPTVEALVRSLASGRDASGYPSTQLPAVRPVTRDDFQAICQFLNMGFQDNSIPWSRLFEYDWIEDRPDHGFLLTIDERIIGFLGTVYSRPDAGGRGVTWLCNLSSWFVEHAYRGWGSYLLWAATRRTDTIYTSITPGRETQSMLKTLRYRTLDKERHFLPLLNPRTIRRGRLATEFDLERIRLELADNDRKILDDHASYDLLHVLIKDDRGSAYLILKRRLLFLRRKRRIPSSELLYCNNTELLARNFERIKLTALWRQKSLIFVAHEGFVPAHIASARRISGDRYASATTLPAHHHYLLYSELVLMPV